MAYPTGKKHHNWKQKRNLAIVTEKYPQWPDTSVQSPLRIVEICFKYKISESRFRAIVNRMKNGPKKAKTV